MLGPEGSNKNEGSGENDRRPVSRGVPVHDLGGRPRVQGVQVHPCLRQSGGGLGEAVRSVADQGCSEVSNLLGPQTDCERNRERGFIILYFGKDE